jgi:hypothetical protein
VRCPTSYSPRVGHLSTASPASQHGESGTVTQHAWRAARLDPAPQSFERILEWLLDGIEGTLVTAPG